MNYEIWRSYNTVFKESYTSLMRTHKSYVINMNYCYRVDKNLAYIKDTNFKIPVSQRNYKNVSKKFREINSILKWRFKAFNSGELKNEFLYVERYFALLFKLMILF